MSQVNFKHDLGDCVKDNITNFQGIVTGRCNYITGCNQILVQPPVKDNGDFVESHWIDEDRLKIVAKAAVTVVVETNGPDKPAPRK